MSVCIELGLPANFVSAMNLKPQSSLFYKDFGYTIFVEMLTEQEQRNQSFQINLFVEGSTRACRQCKKFKPQLLLYINLSSLLLQSCGSVVEFITCG